MIYEVLNVLTGEKKPSSVKLWNMHYSTKRQNGQNVWKIIREVADIQAYKNEQAGTITIKPLERAKPTDISNTTITEKPDFQKVVFVFKENRVTIDQFIVKIQNDYPENIIYNQMDNTYTIVLERKPENNPHIEDEINPFNYDINQLRTWLDNQKIEIKPTVKKLETLQKLIPEIYLKTQK